MKKLQDLSWDKDKKTEKERILHSPIGNIEIMLNGVSYDYSTTVIPFSERFKVDARYEVVIAHVNENDILTVGVKNPLCQKFGAETGEAFESIGFYENNFQMNIGVIGDLPNVEYEYSDSSLQLKFKHEYNNFKINIAWIHFGAGDFGTNAWFMAEPGQI